MKIKLLMTVSFLSIFAQANELLSTTEQMYDEKVINSNVILNLNAYCNFVEKIVSNYSESDDLPIDEILAKMVDGIISFRPNVSTNVVDNGTPNDVVSNRRWIAYSTLCNMFKIKADEDMCRKVASYIGTVRKVDFPDVLTWFHLEQMFDDYDEFKAFEKRTEKERKLQMRVYIANSGIRSYRESLLSGCNVAVNGLKGKMSEESFNLFTNEIKCLSRAEGYEAKALLRIETIRE